MSIFRRQPRAARGIFSAGGVPISVDVVPDDVVVLLGGVEVVVLGADVDGVVTVFGADWVPDGPVTPDVLVPAFALAVDDGVVGAVFGGLVFELPLVSPPPLVPV